MAKRRALVVWGGWDGHEPRQVAEVFRGVLEGEGFEVEVNDSLGVFDDGAKLKGLSLIVPAWTMGRISAGQVNNVLAAVESGVGVAGCHGGMGDAFRESTEWQFMVGGQFVAHPGNMIKYKVHVKAWDHPVMEGIQDFDVETEQYYMHVDPGNRVLASTVFPVADGPHVGNGVVEMPVVWTRKYGEGRVFYNSLGHDAKTVGGEPCLTLMRRGFLWAAR